LLYSLNVKNVKKNVKNNLEAQSHFQNSKKSFYDLLLLLSICLQCFGVRKSIRPGKKLSDGLLAWLSVWSVVQMNCIWSSWYHCHHFISFFS